MDMLLAYLNTYPCCMGSSAGRLSPLDSVKIVCLGSYLCGGYLNVCPEVLMFMYPYCSFPTRVLMFPLGAPIVILLNMHVIDKRNWPNTILSTGFMLARCSSS